MQSDMFFHKFYTLQSSRAAKKAPATKRKQDAEDGDDSGSSGGEEGEGEEVESDLDAAGGDSSEDEEEMDRLLDEEEKVCAGVWRAWVKRGGCCAALVAACMVEQAMLCTAVPLLYCWHVHVCSAGC